MPSKPTTPIQVPFDREGNQLNYGGYGSYLDQNVTWVDNFEFEAALTIKDLYKGRSALNFSLVDELTGKRYTMFMKDMMDLIAKCTIIKGTVAGTWTFRKQGSNFGIKAVLP